MYKNDLKYYISNIIFISILFITGIFGNEVVRGVVLFFTSIFGVMESNYMIIRKRGEIK